MANNNSGSGSGTGNKVNVPEAKKAMENFKYEVANEIGVPLKKGYNGDLTSAQNGYVGGYMVKKMLTRRSVEFTRTTGCTNTEVYSINYICQVGFM